jgi:hypothetical protein
MGGVLNVTRAEQEFRDDAVNFGAVCSPNAIKKP